MSPSRLFAHAPRSQAAADARRAPRPTALALLAILVLATACNLIDTRAARDATLSRMIPGPGAETGSIECWLTLEFNRYPTDADLHDVVVRFESIALAAPARFDWEYIAAHDKLTGREGFGSGLHEAEATRPAERPPLGRPTQVRFPLLARSSITDAPSTLYLEAELYWGGERQHTLRQSLEHVYATEPDDLY